MFNNLQDGYTQTATDNMINKSTCLKIVLRTDKSHGDVVGLV
jgi:hypothetical protein